MTKSQDTEWSLTLIGAGQESASDDQSELVIYCSCNTHVVADTTLGLKSIWAARVVACVLSLPQ